MLQRILSALLLKSIQTLTFLSTLIDDPPPIPQVPPKAFKLASLRLPHPFRLLSAQVTSLKPKADLLSPLLFQIVLVVLLPFLPFSSSSFCRRKQVLDRQAGTPAGPPETQRNEEDGRVPESGSRHPQPHTGWKLPRCPAQPSVPPPLL